MTETSSAYAIGISQLIGKYDAFVIDQWGVIHDGKTLYPGVLHVLTELKRALKPVVILTNSSKTAEVNKNRLANTFGLDSELYTALVSSAQVSIEWLQTHGREFFGSATLRTFVVADGSDATIVEGSSLERTSSVAEAVFILLLSVDPHQDVRAHLEWIEAACKRRLPLVCCSADQLTVTREGVYTGLRAIVSEYEKAGGKVLNFGKPERYVYELCESALPGIARDRVLAIGDQLESDIIGAKHFGFDSALVRTGAAEKEFPPSLSIAEAMEKIKRRAELGLITPDWLLAELAW